MAHQGPIEEVAGKSDRLGGSNYQYSGTPDVGTQPILVSLGAHTLSVATLVVVSDGGRHLGCFKVFVSLIYRLYSVSMPGQVLE